MDIEVEDKKQVNRFLQKSIHVLLITGYVISGCTPGGSFGSTFTPNPSSTSTRTRPPTLTQAPTQTSTPTIEPVVWDISPDYTETISETVLGVLPIDISIETDIAPYRYGLRAGWTSLKGQTAEESLAELWARAIFEAWWYNGDKKGEPSLTDFRSYVNDWANCQNNLSGEDCWGQLQLEIIANNLHTFDYETERLLIRPPAVGRIIFVGTQESIRNMTRDTGGCGAYGINFLDGELILYLGKFTCGQCRLRAALMAENIAIALTRLQTRRQGAVFSPPSDIFTNYIRYSQANYDSVTFIREKLKDVSC